MIPFQSDFLKGIDGSSETETLPHCYLCIGGLVQHTDMAPGVKY